MTSVIASSLLSFKVAIVSTAMVLLIGTAIAYLLARREFVGKTLFDVVTTLPLVLPPTVTGYYLILLFGKEGILGEPIYSLTGWTIMFTWQAAVLASFTVSLPLMIKSAKAAIQSVDKNLIDTAHTLGHSEWTTFFKVILPLSKRGIFAGAVLAFARALGEFGATLMVAGNIPGKTGTMPLAIYSAASSGDWFEAHVLVAFFTVFSGIALFVSLKSSQSGA